MGDHLCRLGMLPPLVMIQNLEALGGKEARGVGSGPVSQAVPFINTHLRQAISEVGGARWTCPEPVVKTCGELIEMLMAELAPRLLVESDETLFC